MRSFQRLAALTIISSLCIGFAAWGGEIPHQYGIELRGAYGMYLDNADPNNFVQGFTGTAGYNQQEYSKSQGALGGGISLLYKSKDYFCWHIGMNVLSTDSATATAVGNAQPQYGRVFMSAVELFVTANYYWNITSSFNLQIGAGPSFVLASLDREATTGAEALYGDSFYGAHGRSFGALGTAGAELFLSHGFSIHAGGGFRYAPVARFKFLREINTTTGTEKQAEIVYWPDTFNTFAVDFTGAFAEIGLRFYFEPELPWDKIE